MPDPIGSVYLDGPQPGRMPSPPARRVRATIAGYFGAIGIVGLTAAGLLTGIRSTVATPDPIVDAVTSTFDDPASRAEMEAKVAEAIQTSMFEPEFLESAEVLGIDYQTEVDAWSEAVLADPEFSSAVGDLITEIHGRLFVATEAGLVDVSPLTDIVVEHAEEQAPTLAPFLPPGRAVITIDPSGWPDLSRPMSLLDQAILVALVSGAGLLLALAVHDRRHRVFTWIGRWLLVSGLLLGLGSIGLPWIAGQLTGWITVETAVQTTSVRLLAPAGIAGAVGMTMASIAAVLRRRERRKVAEEGANAWLEVVEPPLFNPPASPSLELARRGLVDGSRQLTNG